MKLYHSFILAIFGIFACSAAFCDPIVIKFSHVVARDTPKGKAADYFAQIVSQRTKGAVKVEVYPNSQLYKDQEELEALQLGAVEMLAPSLAKFGALGIRDFEVFDLPFIFDSYKDLHKVTYGPLGLSLLKKLEPKGITGLAYWDNGFKNFSANKITKNPADFKGLKMRIQSSKVLDSQMRALGAVPQVMPFSDVYQKLQAGVIDGTENPPSNFYTQKMHEVQKYMVQSQHGYLGYAVITNKDFWSKLPADIRKTLEDAIVEATRYANQIAQAENEAATAAIQASGKTQLITLTQDERHLLKKALMNVHKEHAARIGEALIQSVYRETGATLGK